jgi:tRNA threonylcarbamoyladenosine biosynthesis protein TsaB
VLLLGIDTATPVTSVAIGTEHETLAALDVRAERGHARLLAPAVRWLLEEARIEAAALGGVAVGVGPGLFSGLRVGVGTAKALAQAWGRPMVAVSSLDLLAFAHRQARRAVCAVIDGRRGEVFAALYRQVPGGAVRLTQPQVIRPDELAAGIQARSEDMLLVGDGALAYRRVFERLAEQVELGSPARSWPSATCLVELAAPRFEREEFVQSFEVTPLYLRRPDIDPHAERHVAGGARRAVV